MQRGCVAASFPPGCSGGWEGLLPRLRRRRKRVTIEERGEYCVVREYRVVFRREICEELRAIIDGSRLRHLLLLGPPGTGKSMFLRIVEDAADVNVYRVEPERLISKYIGETEQRLIGILDEAERNRPAVIIIDEADFMIERRGGGGDEDGYKRVSEAIVRVLLRRLQEWSEAGDIAMIASSNKPLSAIDEALTRSGRFRVLYFPVPDVEAVKLLFEVYGKKPPSDEEIVKLLMVAPSYSNIVEYIRTGKLREFEISPFLKILSVPLSIRGACKIEAMRAVIIDEPHPLSAMVAALHSMITRGKPVILLLEPRRYEDGVWMSKSIGFPLAIPYSPLIADAVYSIIYRTDAVYLLGREWDISLPSMTLNDIASMCSEYRLKKVLGCGTKPLSKCLMEKLL